MEGVIYMHSQVSGEACGKDMKNLHCTEDSYCKDVATDIAINLGESNDCLVLAVVTKLGARKAIEIYYKVKSIEQSGGMLTTDGLRRRTPGGVFFHLVNTDPLIDNDIKKEIFQDTSRAQNKMKNQAIKEKRKKKNEELKELLVKEGLLSVNYME